MHKRCSYHVQNSDALLIPHSQVDVVARRWIAPPPSMASLSIDPVSSQSHRKKSSRGNRPREASGDRGGGRGGSSRTFRPTEFRNVIIAAAFLRTFSRARSEDTKIFLLKFYFTANIIVI